MRVSEDISIGSEVISLLVTDVDEGSNVEVCYSIVFGNENRIFEMNFKNGILSIIRFLDREITFKYRIVV